MKTQYIRKGNTIYKLSYDPDGTTVVNKEAIKYTSINSAKRESRRLQGSNPGSGLVRVERHKRHRLMDAYGRMTDKVQQ